MARRSRLRTPTPRDGSCWPMPRLRGRAWPDANRGRRDADRSHGVALGAYCAGLFSNNEDVTHAIEQAAATAGERVWPMPMDDEYDKLMGSSFADMRSWRAGGRLDHRRDHQQVRGDSPGRTSTSPTPPCATRVCGGRAGRHWLRRAPLHRACLPVSWPQERVGSDLTPTPLPGRCAGRGAAL